MSVSLWTIMGNYVLRIPCIANPPTLKTAYAMSRHTPNTVKIISHSYEFDIHVYALISKTSMRMLPAYMVISFIGATPHKSSMRLLLKPRDWTDQT